VEPGLAAETFLPSEAGGGIWAMALCPRTQKGPLWAFRFQHLEDSTDDKGSFAIVFEYGRSKKENRSKTSTQKCGQILNL
jgi:hypothetical protein